MRIYASRVILYVLLMFCGLYLFIETTKSGPADVNKTAAAPQEDWKAKRVLFGTGLLSPPDMRNICFNKTLVSRESDYPLIPKTPLYRVSQTFYLCRKYNMLVCSVPKAGSSFWTTTMAQITGASNGATDLLPEKSVLAKLDQQMRIDYDKTKKTFNGYKIITVRNPFTRLFSAYVDEVFLPNNLALNEEIRDAVKGSSGSSSQEKICLNDLTFSDFLLYVTKNNKVYSNPKWTPITNMCEPCSNGKVIVVREEHFINDTRKVLRRVGLPEARIRTLTSTLSKKYDKQTMSIVETLLHDSFLHESHVCLSTLDILKRIWKSLQIHGRISNSADFPDSMLSKEASITTLKSKFRSALNTVVSNKEMTQQNIRNQRNGALISEYKTIHPGIIEDIRKLYYNDFALFNYNMHVPTLKTLE